MKRSTKFLALLYTISMAFAFCPFFGDYLIHWKIQISIAGVWVLLFLGILIKNKFISKYSYESLFTFKAYFIPHLLIHAYTILLIIFNIVDKNLFTTNLKVYIPVLLVVTSLSFFGEKILKYNCIALVVAWFATVIGTILFKGFEIFPYSLNQMVSTFFGEFDKNNYSITKNYLEMHDIVLAIGYILIYYFYKTKKFSKKELLFLILILFFEILGLKRIVILGLLVVFIIKKILDKFPDDKKYKLAKYIGIASVFLCYLFIFILSNTDIFYTLVSKLGINTMGRTYYYQKIISYSNFSPFFLGLGRNSVWYIFTSKMPYSAAVGVHSDIIKMFVENGFIVFGLWCWYYLVNLTKKYKEKYGYKTSLLYFFTIIYSFSLYLTDNTENYFICQIFSISIPIVFYLSYIKDTKCNPKVSVIMSTLNTDETYLKLSIDSILNQTYKNIELIIVNDGGEDYKYIEDNYNDDRIKVIKNEKSMGLAYSLNRALEFCSGEYIARMDSDDISLKCRIEEQVKYMAENKDVGICSTFYKKFGSQDSIVAYPFYEKNYINSLLFFGNALCHPAVMFRKSYLIDSNKKYDVNFIYSQDYDFWTRCKDTSIALVPKVVFLYRMHDKQVSSSKREKQRELYETVLKRNLVELDLDNYDISMLKTIHGDNADFNMHELYYFIEEAIIHNDIRGIYNRKIFKKILYNRFFVLFMKYEKRKLSNIIEYRKMIFRVYNLTYIFRQIFIKFKTIIETW